MKPSSLLFLIAAQAVTLSLPSAPALGRELVKSDEAGIRTSGQVTARRRSDFKLQAGLYDVNELDSKWSTKFHLVVEENINDPRKSYALLFSKNAVDERRTKAWVYSALPMERDGRLMLSPVFIDNEGNLRNGADVSDEAPVLELVERDGRYTYPYILKGRNGALNGHLLGMNAAPDSSAHLRSSPSNGVFAATANGKFADILVDGSEISINSGELADQTYSMAALNGDGSGFATLMRSKLHTRSRREVVDEEIKKLAAFMSDRSGNEVLFMLTPNMDQWGQYTLITYEIASPGFLEFLFPGRRHQGAGN